jgi:hypothetical protein
MVFVVLHLLILTFGVYNVNTMHQGEGKQKSLEFMKKTMILNHGLLILYI